jgi:phosphatidylglycerophosphate synthase
MSKYIHFCHTCPVQIWGMTSQQRIERILGETVRSCSTDELKNLTDSDTVLILRGDYLFDDRLIENLAGMPNVLLNVQDRQPQTAVAAHVPAGLAQQVLDLISGKTTDVALPGVKNLTPSTFPLAFQKKLRKKEPPFVLPITAERKKDLERRLFDWSYKGVTDLVTKWAWPFLARQVVGHCVRLHIRPNQVTLAGLVLVIIAGISFAVGQYGIGLAAGWLMTFLDTVDGKLARVTLTSSRFGHYFDHVIDLVHPPLWYILWAIGLPESQADGLGLPLSTFFWVILVGYIGGRLVEGSFQLLLGRFSIFCWRPFDSYFRLITARRNPNLILLTLSFLADRPDLGLVAVTIWTVASTLILLVRLATAGFDRARQGGPLSSWLSEADSPRYNHSRAARIFAGHAGR